MIQTLLKERDEQYLLANIAIVEEQMKTGKVSNPTGYLLKAFQNDYRPVETEYAKQQQVALENKKTEQKEKEKALLLQEARSKKIEQQKTDLIRSNLTKIGREEFEKLKLEFLPSIESNHIFSKYLESK